MWASPWEDFVRRLCDVSAEFARMWATHDVARPGSTMKIFRHSTVGELRFSSISLGLPSPKEARIVVYTPNDELTRERVEWLRAHPDIELPEHAHAFADVTAGSTVSDADNDTGNDTDSDTDTVSHAVSHAVGDAVGDVTLGAAVSAAAG